MKLCRDVKNYFAVRDIPYDLIRGIITATCGVVFGLISSAHYSGIKKKKLYQQLVVNAMYDMNRTCNQSKKLYETFLYSDSLFARIDSLYIIGQDDSITADDLDDMVMLMAMPLHPVSYATIEGVFRGDFQTFENIDNIELESLMSDFFAARDQYYGVYDEYNNKTEHIWNMAITQAEGCDNKSMIDAIIKSNGARHFMRRIHTDYTKLLGVQLESMQKKFVKILNASDVSIDDLNELSIQKSKKPLNITNPFLKQELEKKDSV